MTHLPEALSCLRNCEFNNPGSWPQQGAPQDVLLQFITISNTTLRSFYEHLNLSLLSGEYVNTPTALEYIKSISKALGELPSTMEAIPLPFKEQLDYNLFTSFIKPMSSSLKLFQKLISHLNRKLSDSDYRVLFEAETIDEMFRIGLNTFASDAPVYQRIFTLNLSIANHDHNIAVDKKFLSELVIYKRELENINLDLYYKKLILDKCNFLIKKIAYRFKEDKKNYTYAFDFTDIRIESENIKLNYLNDFDQRTITSYDHNKLSRDEWTKIYEKIITQSNRTFLEYHTALQFYKDVSKNAVRVKKLREDFEIQCESFLKENNVIPYDKYAIAICNNYFLNNELSIFLDNPRLEFTEAKEFLEKIKSLQKETFVFNYFPFLKFCEFTCKRIEELLGEQDLDIEKFGQLRNCLEETLKEAYRSFEWCKERNFVSYQLPQSESTCLALIDERKIPVYIASSFVLPINYEKLERDLIEVSKKLDTYQRITEVHKSIRSEKEAIKQIRKDIEKVDRRAIEIIGIFAAIVLFASGSIQIFSISGITFKDGLSWMLLFAYCLILFVFSIWLITRDSLKSITPVHWFFFACLGILFVISLLTVFGGKLVAFILKILNSA